MSAHANPDIVTDGLTFCIDGADPKSYSGSGSTVYDRSGNLINGSVNNATVDSEAGGCFSFDGTNEHISIGTPSLLDGVQVPLSICVWAKHIGSFKNYEVLWGVDYSTSNHGLWSMLRIDSGNFRYYTSTSSGGYQSRTSFSVENDVWNYYVVTMEGSVSSSTCKHYLNGSNLKNGSAQSFSMNALSSTPYSPIDFRIGNNQRAFEYWKGKIATAMWYNKALSAAEILQNFNATKSRFGL